MEDTPKYCIFATDNQSHRFMMNKIRYGYSTALLVVLLLVGCTSHPHTQTQEEKEDTHAKSLMQGLWLDDLTDFPVFRVEGDTIYYSDSSIAPVAFKVVQDSLKTYGSQTIGYHIKKQTEYSISIQSITGDILQLRKAENNIDSIGFNQQTEVEPTPDEVFQKDRVLFYNNVRYRGYVYINPSEIKVIQPSISEEGLEIDNIYYDNIIHICVYEGKKELFSKDIHKEEFTGIIPDDFLQRGILSDMDFVNVNERGYHYQATVCIPNGSSCYLVNIYISFQGEIAYELVE